ncbi:hypothetical protein [Nocardia mexicana]|uniref:Parallel beta helix pectate lyase-like protein n=1 Tax=Nocardia mexicana TaxID=279262 RepID=A0A370GQU4_9NOCA|nr:hypothetical protein [Nocardia mexicana]RDI44854.1 hypothetical protein DFR68_1156 [Nocardia mexicana]
MTYERWAIDRRVAGRRARGPGAAGECRERGRPLSVPVLAVLVGVVASLNYGAAQADPGIPATWYVVSGAAAGGNGSEAAPFGSLEAVERAGSPGDTIVVLPAPRNAPPLDGGIALKPGQQLIGAGPAVTEAPAAAPVPRLTNSRLARDGDAVKLARGAAVRNLVIDGATRGGIYGNDVADVTVSGNDISGTNRLCHDGFMIGPFQVPVTLPAGVAVAPLPPFLLLNNGWAAVMVDAATATGTVRIEGNRVHDTGCGDGIDVRTFGSATVAAELTDNTLTHINLGLAKLSILAIGLQSNDDSRLEATLTGNTETDIASPAGHPGNLAADSEGIFINPTGRSWLRARVDRHRFDNGGGNFSANGLEYVTTSGSPTSEVTVTDSTFDRVVGDVIENYNLSGDAAEQQLTLDGVRAMHSTFPGAAAHPVVPVNLGTCLVTTGFGRASKTGLVVRNSEFGDCSGDGIGIVSYTPEGGGAAEMSFDIQDSRVSGAAVNGLNVLVVGNPAALRVRVQDSSITGAAQAAIRADRRGGESGSIALDFGGGALGSTGNVCVAGPVQLSGVSVDGSPGPCTK